MTNSSSRCLGTEELAAFFDGLGDEMRGKEIQRHLQRCEQCRELVEEMSAPVVEDVIQRLIRRHGLTVDEREEVSSILRLQSFQKGLVTGFRGRSRLSTFLCTSLNRMFVDWRRSQHGRWRPSSGARRMGPPAEFLEFLVIWERMPFRRAVEEVRARWPRLERSEIERMAGRIRHRPRPLTVGDEALQSVPTCQTSEDRLRESQHQATAHKISHQLAEEISSLSPEDQVLLKMRFISDLSVVQIARAFDHNRRQLYGRYAKLFKGLRMRLLGKGFDENDIRDILDDPSTSIHLGFDDNEGNGGDQND